MQNTDIKDKYYTLTVSQAYDYTEYSNKLPILNGKFTFKTNGALPDLPPELDKSIDVVPIRNRDANVVREELGSTTVVGYNIKANYNNSQLYAKKITYKVHKKDTCEVITSKTIDINDIGEIPVETFNVGDGTHYDTIDINEMKRGNSYYFSFELDLDLDGDGSPETKYPPNTSEGEKIELTSGLIKPAKQEARIIMYPS